MERKSFSDSYALYYELVICRAYKCKRYDVDAADADIYRHLLESYWALDDSIKTNSGIEEARIKFNEICKLVSDNLHDAVLKLVEDYCGFSEIESLFPQTSIEGINCTIDKILEVIREKKI